MAETPVPETNRFMYGKNHPIEFKTRCHLCLHKFAGIPGCAAFPRGIPHALAAGEVMHETPYPNDQGIMFEPNPRFVKKEE